MINEEFIAQVYFTDSEFLDALRWCEQNCSKKVSFGGSGNIPIGEWIIWFRERIFYNDWPTNRIFEFSSQDDATIFRLRYC